MVTIWAATCTLNITLFTLYQNVAKKTNTQNIQSTVPSKPGKDTKSYSLHFEWHLQFLNYEKLTVEISLVPNNAKQALFSKNSTEWEGVGWCKLPNFFPIGSRAAFQ